MKKLTASFCSALAFLAMAFGTTQAQAACPSQQVVFLFDQSNSMNWNGSDGNPKSQKVRAKFEMDWAKVNSDAVVAIVGFGNVPNGADTRTLPAKQVYVDLAQSLTKGANSAELLAAADLAATPSVSYNTPLAYGVCESVDLIKGFNTTCAMTTQRTIYMYTDGAENSSPDTGSGGCYSATSSAPAVFDPNQPKADFGLTPQTWEWKMAMKAYCNNVTVGCNSLTMPDPLRPVFNVTVLFDWLNRLSTPNSGLDGAPLGTNLQALDATTLSLFAGLPAVTGGEYFEAKKVDGIDALIPYSGDTDPEFNCTCVNDADLDRVLEAFGMPVEEGLSIGKDDLARRDVTNDRVVDVNDYYLVAADYGLCQGTKPGCNL